MLFQVILLDLMNLATILFLFTGYILLIISGTINLEREEKVKGSVAFIAIGAALIIYEMIRFPLYILADDILPSGLEEYYVITLIIPNIISLITFGLLIMVLGKINIDNQGKNLLISGILWTIYAVVMLIINIGAIIPFPGSPTLIIVIGIIGLVILALMIASRIFLLIYTIKIEDTIMLVSSILLLVSAVAYVIFDLILTFVP
ncbi:MAG: hypothetical protein ACFFFB_17560 [Candidatus Heimdallarchaeota archaeon]